MTGAQDTTGRAAATTSGAQAPRPTRLGRRLRHTAVIALLAACALAPTAAEAAKKPKRATKIDKALTERLDRQGGGTVRVILRVAPGKDADVRAALGRKHRTLAAEHALIGAVTVEVEDRKAHV